MSSSPLHPTLRRWFCSFIPAPATTRWGGCARSAVGTLVDILFTGTIMKVVSGASTLVPLLVAPTGASAVLLFAMPTSPLAQPWSIIGGSPVTTTMGVTFTLLVNDPMIASVLTISVATTGMFALRYVHPPLGAVALTVVTGGPAMHALDYHFVLEPILIQSTLLLVGVPVYHAATGHRYPHAQHLPAAERPPTAAGFTRTDIVAALRRQSELLDINPEDIKVVLREMQLQTYIRTFRAFTRADIMTAPTVMVLAGTPTPCVLELLRQHGFRASPVVDERRCVVGVVTRAGLLSLAPAGMRQTLRRWFSISVLTPPCVADHMKTRVQTIAANAPMSNLVLMFASAGHHHTLVLDADNRLAGIITGSDLVGGPYRQANIEPQAT